MLGLIKKDLVLSRDNFRKIYIIIVGFSLLPAFQNAEYFLLLTTLIISLMFASQVIETIALDEQSGWKKAVLSMPVNVFEIVLSKYILALIFAIMTTVILVITSFAARVLFGAPWYSIIFSILQGFLLIIIFNLLNIPVSYRYGTEASRYFMLLFVAIPVAAVYVFRFLKIDIGNYIYIIMNHIILFIVIVFVFCLCLICISLYISVRDYQKYV